MSQELWNDVDRYITDLLVPQDDALERALADSIAAGLPTINVASNQGKLLMILAKIRGAKNILEIGTLGGYSTIWLGRGLASGGKLTTLEMSPKHAEVARKNIARAGLADVVTIRVGAALETLPKLGDEKLGPFDLVFIDADKQNTAEYFDWALRLSQSGTVIIVDNVIRKGEVANPNTTKSEAQGIRRFYDRLAGEKRVVATAYQTVGSKGHDGLSISVVI